MAADTPRIPRIPPESGDACTSGREPAGTELSERPSPGSPACWRCAGTGALDFYLYGVAMEWACLGVWPTVLRRLA